MPIVTSNFKYGTEVSNKNDISKEKDMYNGNNKVETTRKKINTIHFNLTEPVYSLDEMILPKKIKDKINDVICSRLYGQTIFDEWGLGEILPEFKNKIAVNLYGEPGTGKTMAAHAIAKALNKKLLKINYAEIESKYVGETAKNLESAFKEAKEKQAVLFFDEADALLSRRVTNMNNSTDVSVNQTRSVLLMLMNTYDDTILFTTNFINNFDEAFMRRIQFHIKFDMPDIEARTRLWKKYIPEKMPNDVEVESLSRKYENISGSDIANAVLAAAFKAVRSRNIIVKSEFFEEAIESIIKSKNDNRKLISSDMKAVNIEKKYVDEEYVKKQIKENGGGKICY